MSNILMRLRGILSQDFVNGADNGAYLDGASLWLVVTERGRRYELRDSADPEFVGDVAKMTLELARRAGPLNCARSASSAAGVWPSESR